MGELVITSSAFKSGGRIPEAYARKGGNMSPPLHIEGVHPGAKTIAIIVDDPDIPVPVLSFTHWAVYNIPVTVADIHENVPREPVVASLGGAMQGKNGFGRIGYTGLNPPFGTHTYRFRAYALDTALSLKPGAGRKQLIKAIDGHVLQTGLLEGKFGV